MILKKLLYFFAFLFALPLSVFGQRVPVAPDMLLDIGGVGASATPHILKFDDQGNIYVAGEFTYQVDFDPSSGVTNLPENSVSAYVAKYSPAGTLVWAKSYDLPHSYIDGLNIGRDGSITAIGQAGVANTEPGDLTYRNCGFILHLDNNGSVLWKKFVTGTKGPQAWYPGIMKIPTDKQTGYKVSSDAAGNLIAVFSFQGTADFDGKITAKSETDGLVVKYDPDGNVIWKFTLGATGFLENLVLDALVDKNNNIIIAGYTNGTINYNPLGAPVNITKNSAMFIAKYSPSGILQWIKSIDGYMVDYNMMLALDGQDNIYVNGTILSPIDFGVAPPLSLKGNQDIFVAKYSSDGNLLYYRNIGGAGAYAVNRAIRTGPDGSLYLTGSVKGRVDFDLSASVGEVNSNGANSVYLAKYDNNGNYQWVFGISDLDLSLDYPKIKGSELSFGARYVNVNNDNEILLTGTFSRTVNFDGTGCGVSNMTAQGADMFIVRYTPTPLTPIINNTITFTSATAVCKGDDPAVITGSVPTGNVYTYQWQQSANNIAFTDIPGAVLKDFDPPAITATTYYRRRLVSSVCAAPNISNVVTLIFSNPATANTITAPSVSSFCNAGDAGLIHGSEPQANGNPVTDFQWQQSTDNVTFTDIAGATAKDYNPPVVTTTTYYRRLITATPCNIRTPGNTVTITVTQTPAPTISAEQTICRGDDVTLTATGGTRYLWSPATGLSSSGIASPVAKPDVSTTYSVTVYNGDCNATLSVKVNVIAEPTVNAGADKDIINGDMVQLDARVSAAEGVTYRWTPVTYLDNPNIANPNASPSKSINYRLTVTSAQGCFTVSDDVAINVHENILVPNTFTPNGDGINDVLMIDGLDSYKQSLFTVFNRSGQQVFKSLAYPKPWDGTHNGKPIPMGTYYYIIEFNNGQKRLSGYVNLMK